MTTGSFARLGRYGQRLAGVKLAGWALSGLAALSLGVLIVLGGLAADLCATGGRVEVAGEWNAPFWAVADATSPGSRTYENAGLLPLVYRSQGTPFGLAVRLMTGVFPLLRTNGPCLLTLVLLAIAAGSIRHLALWRVEVAGRRAAEGLAGQLRSELYEQRLRLGPRALVDQAADVGPELFRFHVDTIRRLMLEWWTTIWPNLPAAAVSMLLALAVEPWMALASILLCILGGVVYWLIAGRTLASATAGPVDQQAAAEARFVEAPLRSAFDGTDAAKAGFAEALLRWSSQSARRQTSDAYLRPLLHAFVVVGGAMVVGLACTNVLRQPPRVVPAATVILLCSVGSAFRPLKRLWRCRAVAERAVAEAIPVWEWLEQKPQPAVVPKAGTIRPLAGELSLLNVTVRDGAGNLRVDNVSLSVPAGGQVALFADQPATLTALVSLLPRWCDPERGAIVMDGQDIKGATLESLRTEVALVVAEPLIFSGTVADNITCGDPRLVSKLMTKAARWTNAYSFIQALPQNFDTVIGHGGHPLTIAEQFRIALARALIRNPSLVVIEEPDVPLPPEVAELVDQAIDRISANRTLIRIPARLSGLRQAQRVAVFGEGKLVAEGTHADLLKTCDLYRHLQYLRFNEFRPAPVEPQPRLRAS